MPAAPRSLRPTPSRMLETFAVSRRGAACAPTFRRRRPVGRARTRSAPPGPDRRGAGTSAAARRRSAHPGPVAAAQAHRQRRAEDPVAAVARLPEQSAQTGRQSAPSTGPLSGAQASRPATSTPAAAMPRPAPPPSSQPAGYDRDRGEHDRDLQPDRRDLEEQVALVGVVALVLVLGDLVLELLVDRPVVRNDAFLERGGRSAA